MKEQNSEFTFPYHMKSKENKFVILIDDDPVTNVINTRLIQKYFTFKVNVFTDPTEALGRLKHWAYLESQEFPDIIFLDINMPDMDGWDFLEAFQNFPPEIQQRCQVIILTSSIDFYDIKKSRTYSSVKDFISKPLTPEKLRLL
jgi:CheY-like chemotaxis protein